MEKTEDQKIIEQAHKAFEVDFAYESDARNLFKEDLRFSNGDPDNKFQWEQSFVRARELNGRPCLTINKIKIHNRQITNEARQNKPSVRVYPVDSGADRKTADIFNGIIRHIEQNSDAETAYDIASEFAVDAGIGYWRIITDYASDDSFDQEIFIKPIKNPLNVLMDSRIQEPDGSDAKRAFIFRDIPKDEFENDYPRAEGASWDVLPGQNSWRTNDSVRVAEYFYVDSKDDVLYALPDGTTALESEIPKNILDDVKANAERTRKVKSPRIKWCLIAGDEILEKKDWAGKYIPIVRVVGEEHEIDGKLDRKGHTRPMKDAQRMYNYNASASIEYGALQTKTPIIAANEAIDGFEKYWERANTENLPYLPFNHLDEGGSPLPIPQRMTAPAPAMLFIEGMNTASEQMNMASGQYESQFGNNPQNQSGRAINALQRKGDIATFHFIDNVSRAIKYTGKILVDLIPKIYDTSKVIRILGEDGTEKYVQLNPKAERSYIKQRDQLTGEVQEIFNPTVGRYDVAVSVGASYTTRRQEAFDSMIQLAQGNPQLMQVAGDLIMKAADFPMADQLANRLEKTLPPGLKDNESEDPEVQAVKAQAQQIIQQLQQQLQAAEQAMQEAQQEFAELKQQAESKDAEITIKAKETEIKAFDAETKRLQVELTAAQTAVNIDDFQQLQNAVALLIEQIPIHESTEPPEIEAQEQQPASAGFFTPEGSAQ